MKTKKVFIALLFALLLCPLSCQYRANFPPKNSKGKVTLLAHKGVLYMSKKSRANKEKTTIENSTVENSVAVAVETVGENSPIVDNSDYFSLCKTLRPSLESLYQIKSQKSRRLTFVNSTAKGGEDCISALTVVLAVIFERIDNGSPAYCYKGGLVKKIGELTGVFCKHNPDSPLHQGLNKLGGNQFSFSVDKSGERDTWGSTTRDDLRPVLMINGRMSENTGEIFLNPYVWGIGGYTRPTVEETKNACEYLLRKFRR